VRIGEQIAEPLRLHLGLSDADARARARDWLDRVRIPDAARRLRQYPHELSGGMRQRVMIAAAMAPGPELLIADEPTTALDVTVQAEILDLMAELQRETGTAMALITHDMGVIARLADRVCVMKDGAYVEAGPVADIFQRPRTDYTRALLAAIPRLDRADRGGRPTIEPVAQGAAAVVEGRDIAVHFPIREGIFGKPRMLRAVDGVSFDVHEGETLGVVGESGSGKSTLARAIDLLIHLQKDMGLAMIFISHDLAVVREISHRVLVLYLGRVMELADRDRIWRAPQHPYTKALLSAAPIPDPAVERTRKRLKLPGEPPSPMDPAGAFRFLPSRLVEGRPPALREVAPGHLVSEFDPT
jgi:oligopeptide/dipeptide ABC transporter ATP-binding protein